MTRRFAVLLLLLAPLPAFCLDMDFYTYDGFQETVDAFTRLALIFSDSAYLGFITTVTILGIVTGGLAFGLKAHMGQAVAPVGWMIPLIFGAVLVVGLIKPKGTIYIYDPVLNQNQAVGGVPDLFVLLAGGMNELERSIVEAIDTASANPYGTTGGMLSFNLVMSSIGATPDSIGLQKSVQQYYTDCGVFAIQTNYAGTGSPASLQELLRTSTDLLSTFAKFADPAISTVYYTDTNDRGTITRCDADWAALSVALTTPSTLQSMENTICSRTGFDPTNANEAAACDGGLSAVGSLFGVPAANSQTFMRSVFLAQSVESALQSGDFGLGQSTVMNRSVMLESLGSANAMNEWIPKLRAFMFATILGLLPLLTLFLLTPVAQKAFLTIVGLFAWMFFWGIADASASVMADNAATHAFAQIAQYHLGVESILNMPSGAVKALGVFGKARATAMGLATVVSGALMHFGGVALSSLSSNLQRDLESKGERSAGTVLDPAQRGQTMQGLASGLANEGVADRYGLGSTAVAAGTPMIRTGASASERSVGYKLGFTPSPAAIADREGRAEAGAQLGRYEALGRASAEATAQGISAAGAHGSQFAALGEEKALSDTGYEYGQSLGRSDVGRHNGRTSFSQGYQFGGSGAANLAALMEVYDALNGSEQMTPEGLDRMGRLLEGSRIGQARATSPDQYINQVETLARKTYALADTLRRSPGAAQSVGTVAALKEIAQSDGFLDALHSVPLSSIARGFEFSTFRDVAGARAAEASGGLQHTAEEMAAGSTASALASPAVLRAVASTLNLQGTDQMRLLGAASNRGFAQVAVLLSPANATNVAAGLVRAGEWTQAEATDWLATNPTGNAVLSIDPSGAIQGVRIDTGSSVSDHHTFITERGTSDREFRTLAVDNTQSVRGGMGVIDQPGAVAGLLYRAFGGDFDRGVQNVALLNSVLGNYSSALAEYGLSSKGSSSSISTVSDTIGGSGSLPFGSKGLPVSGSIEVGGQSETVLNRQSSSDVDAATQLVRRAFDHDLVAARKEADVQQAAYAGRGESFDRNAYIARTIETRLHESFGNLKDAAQLDSGYAVDDSKARAAVEPAGLGTTGEFWNELGGDGLRGTAHGLGVGSQDVASPEHFDAGQERLAPADSGGKVSVEGLPSPQITRPAR